MGRIKIGHLLAVSILLIHSTLSSSCHASTIEDGRVWLTYALEHKLNSQWKMTLQMQPYWRDEGRTYDQVTIRPGIYYQYNKHVSFGGGYAYALGRVDSQHHTHEDRLWEDFIYQTTSANYGSSWSARTRFEHRQFEHGGQVLHSLRQQLKWVIPMNAHYSLVVADECYFNLNQTANGLSGFDQNRLFFGVGTTIFSHAGVEFGYMNQYASRVGADIENHILALSVSQSF